MCKTRKTAVGHRLLLQLKCSILLINVTHLYVLLLPSRRTSLIKDVICFLFLNFPFVFQKISACLKLNRQLSAGITEQLSYSFPFVQFAVMLTIVELGTICQTEVYN